MPRVPGPSRRRPGFIRVRWLLLLVCGLAAAGVLGGLFASDGAPPYFQRLVGQGGGALTGVMLLGLGAWLGFGSAGVSGLMRRWPRWALGLPLWAAVLGALALVLFRLASPGLAWDGLDPAHGWVPALLFGYVILLLSLSSHLVSAIGGRGKGDAANSTLFGLLASVPWVVLAHLVLMTYCPADVRTEPPGHVFLALLVGLVGANAACVAYGFRGRGLASALGVLVLTIVLCGPGYLLLRLGLGGPDAGPGETGPAGYLTLLAAEGQPEHAPAWLFVRWCLLQSGAVWTIAVGQLAALRLLERPERAAARDERETPQATEPVFSQHVEPRPSRPGRAYAVLALVWAALIVYGSLVPLEFRSRPFEEAVAAFRETPYLALGVSNRADLIANLLLFVPLAFFAMGSLTREGTQEGPWLFASVVTAGAAVLAVGVEFAQVFFPPRTVSLNDLLAECAGALVGVGLWLGVGPSLTAWLRQAWHAASRPARLANYLLTAYIVGFSLYQLFPFDVVLSAEEMQVQLQEGKLVLRPFAEWARASGVILMAKVLAFVPIGYWAVVRRPGSRRPLRAALVAGLVYAMMIEMLQMFIFSRYSSTTDVVLGACGSLVGGVLARRLGPAAREPLPDGLGWRGVWWLARLAVAAALVAVLVWSKWEPFEVHWPAQGLSAALAERVQVPF